MNKKVIISDVNVATADLDTSQATRCTNCPQHPKMIMIEYKIDGGVNLLNERVFIKRKDFVCPQCGSIKSFMTNLREFKNSCQKK